VIRFLDLTKGLMVLFCIVSFARKHIAGSRNPDFQIISSKGIHPVYRCIQKQKGAATAGRIRTWSMNLSALCLGHFAVQLHGGQDMQIEVKSIELLEKVADQ